MARRVISTADDHGFAVIACDQESQKKGPEEQDRLYDTKRKACLEHSAVLISRVGHAGATASGIEIEVVAVCRTRSTEKVYRSDESPNKG